MDDRIQLIFREILDLDDLVLTEATTANEVPGWDSFTQVKLIIALEEEFGVRFTTHDVAEMQSVGDLEKALKRLSAS